MVVDYTHTHPHKKNTQTYIHTRIYVWLYFLVFGSFLHSKLEHYFLSFVSVSDIGGPKALLFYCGYGKSLYWLVPLVWIRHPLYSWSWCYPIACSDIFKCMLGASPRVGSFSLLVARPYSFIDVGLDFQARLMINEINLWNLHNPSD